MHRSMYVELEARQRAARENAYAMPLSEFHPGNPELFRSDTLWPYFERLRNEEPVHFCSTSPVGNYWSVTKYNDIMHVETNPAIFSSDVNLGGIMLRDVEPDHKWPSFITMDEPKHAPQRKTVSPMFTPTHLDTLAILIRERSASVLDNLPRNETFNWVERVSVELTTQMLATLFDFPWRGPPQADALVRCRHRFAKKHDLRQRGTALAELDECADYFTQLWNERVNVEPRSDLISLMAHSDATRYMDPDTLLGNLILLIVGGNDTTRNSISGSVLALNEHPDEYDKLRGNPALIDSFVPEVIRWQTPLAHMRRTALHDTELGGKLDQKRRSRRDVVRLRQSRQRSDRECRQFRHRSRPAADPSVLRLRHSSLRRHAACRAAAQDRLGRNPETLRRYRGGWRTQARVFELREGLRNIASSYQRVRRSRDRKSSAQKLIWAMTERCWSEI